MKTKVGVLAGLCTLAAGIVWFLFAQSFMSTATTTRGEVTGRDCHGGDSHAPADPDDPDVETCVAMRGQPKGLVLGPLLSFAGVIVLGIVWMMWRDQRNTLVRMASSPLPLT